MYQPIILKYDLKDFEPDISYTTMDLHYNKLYLNYLNKLNKILSNNNFKFNYKISELYYYIEDFPIDVRDDILYNAGGVLNHEMYFRMLTKNHSIKIKEPLNAAIKNQYGSIDNFLKEFKVKAINLSGSGYTFLVLNKNKELFFINLSNQDSPIFYDLYPIMNIDLWEHAYYLDNYNDRSKYIDKFIKYLDFDEINKNYINWLNN